MKVVAVINYKGGVGKTTAVAAPVSLSPARMFYLLISIRKIVSRCPFIRFSNGSSSCATSTHCGAG